jgi:hypothetical protein
MAPSQLPKPGSWFAIPLLDGRSAHGLLARNYKRTYGFAYFFGPATEAPLKVRELQHRTPGSAALVGFFGYLGFKLNEWPVLGEQPGWHPDAWPLPQFVKPKESANSARLITYDDSDISVVLSDTEAHAEAHGPNDGMMGHTFLQMRLTRLLGDPVEPPHL